MCVCLYVCVCVCVCVCVEMSFIIHIVKDVSVVILCFVFETGSDLHFEQKFDQQSVCFHYDFNVQMFQASAQKFFNESSLLPLLVCLCLSVCRSDF